MLDKITFQNGVVVKSDYLNEVQKASSISTLEPRVNFYSAPTDLDHDSWAISYRDGIKDWEIANPSIEPETNIGRLAHDGIILGCNNCARNSLEEIEISFNLPPNITYKTLNDNPLEEGQLGVIINGGKILSEDLSVIEWDTSVVIVEPNSTNYIYVYLEDEVPIVVANSVLPSRATKHSPLAQIFINQEESITDIIDLRQGVYVDSLLNRAGFLRNTPLINVNTTINSWDRAVVDTSNGEIYITMPESPADNDMVSIVDGVGTFSSFAVHLVPNGTQKIDNSFDTITINRQNAQVILFFYEPLNSWLFADSFLSEEIKTLGEFISCGGLECVGITSEAECPNNQPIPAIFPNPSEGYFYYDSSSSKCYKKISEHISIYSDGEGGFNKIFNEKRCQKPTLAPTKIKSSSIKVDLFNGEDDVLNDGITKPFKTIERALLEVAYRHKDFDKLSIEVSPDSYYVDNSPGVDFESLNILDESGLYFRTYTNHTIGFIGEDYIIAISDYEGFESEIPKGLEVGRVIYSDSGANAVITEVRQKQICTNDCGWILLLKYIKGSFVLNDKIYYDNFSVLNPSNGGIVIPSGASLVSRDLRKTKIHPRYVPSIRASSQESTSIFKLTGNTYVSGFTFTDNELFTESHSKLHALQFVSEQELEIYYFDKLKSLFRYDTTFNVEPDINEIGIVYPEDISILSRLTDNFENITGKSDIRSNLDNYGNGDSAPITLDGYIYYPGKIQFEGFVIPDINTIRGASPYIKSCSVRSQFGMSGALIDGSLVKGTRSFVISEFTVVSLQLDPECYENPSVSYYGYPTDPESPKKYKSDSIYRSFGFKAIKGGYAQIVNCFVIGASDHFISEEGGELSVLNSCSNFGDKALTSIGFKPTSYPQDFSNNIDLSKAFFGTTISEIIPPKPLTLERSKINTGLSIDINATKLYYNSLGNPLTYRLYIRTQRDKPSALTMDFGLYAYTEVDPITKYVTLAPGVSQKHRNFLCIDSLQYLNGRTLRTTYFARINDSTLIYNVDLDDKSQIFKYDPSPPIEALTVSGTYTLDAFTSTLSRNDLPSLPESFEEGKYFYIDEDQSVVYTLTRVDKENNLASFVPELPTNFITEAKITFVTNDYLGGLWYIDITEEEYSGDLENQYKLSEGIQNQVLSQKSPIYTYRDRDTRLDSERIYRLKLKGFSSEFGLRPPQEDFVLEALRDYDSPLNTQNVDPVVIKNIKKLDNEGDYEITLVNSSDALKSTTLELYPYKNYDNPELTENPTSSITYKAITTLVNHPLINLSVDSLSPSEYSINVTHIDGLSPFLIEQRKPSIIRANFHVWEWVGHLNYDSAIQDVQTSPFDSEDYLSKLFSEKLGGKIYATGSTEKGNFVFGNQLLNITQANVIPTTYPQNTSSFDADLLSSESFPRTYDFNILGVKNSLSLSSFSSLSLDSNSTIKISSTSTLLNDLGTTLDSSNSNYNAYASESAAGFIQIASQEEVLSGLSNKVAVSPQYLENKLATSDTIGLSKLAKTIESQQWLDSGSGNNADSVITNEVLGSVVRKSTTTTHGLSKLASLSDSQEWVESGIGDDGDSVITNQVLGEVFSAPIQNITNLNSVVSDAWFRLSSTDTIASTSSRYLYLYGSYISLWNEDTWELHAIPKQLTSNRFELNAIGASVPNTTYNVYVYYDAQTDSVSLKCFDNVLNETLSNGVVVKESDPMYRFLGTVYVFEESGQIYTSLNLGGAWSSDSANTPRVFYSNYLVPKPHTLNLIFNDPFPIIETSMNNWDSPASSNPSYSSGTGYDFDPKISFISSKSQFIKAEATILTYYEFIGAHPDPHLNYVLTSVGINLGNYNSTSPNSISTQCLTGTTANRYETSRATLSTQLNEGFYDLMYVFKALIVGTEPTNTQPNKDIISNGLHYGLRLTLEA